MNEGGSWPPSAGGLRFYGFTVKVWWGGAQVVAASSSPMKWEWCGFKYFWLWGSSDRQGALSAVLSSSSSSGRMWLSRPVWRLLIRNQQRRRHGLKVEDEGYLKDEMFCTVHCFF
jgi:hypothetical protein